MIKREWTVGLLATGVITKIKVGDRPVATTANALLGGMFERARLSEDYGILVDESGRLKGLPENKIASLLYGTPIHGAPIVGDAFVCSEVYVDYGGFPELDLVWLTEEQADEFLLLLPEAYLTDMRRKAR